MQINHASLHTYAAAIVDIFEDLLDKHDITIPDEFRNGEPDEAHIFGQTYMDLEQSVYNVLQKFIPAVNDAYLKGYERGCKNAPKPKPYPEFLDKEFNI